MRGTAPASSLRIVAMTTLPGFPRRREAFTVLPQPRIQLTGLTTTIHSAMRK